jgi:hypothetical protein
MVISFLNRVSNKGGSMLDLVLLVAQFLSIPGTRY